MEPLLTARLQAAIEAAGGSCRFTDCMHLMEPGCAVNQQGFQRYDYYMKLLAEIQVSLAGGLWCTATGGPVRWGRHMHKWWQVV
jgi:hypothetical protein